MASWWVYENRLHDRAIVHHSKCPYCNDGKGVHVSSGKYDKWHGSYSTKNEALEFAQSLGRGKTRVCSYCRKHTGK